jgi:hypothetical protein
MFFPEKVHHTSPSDGLTLHTRVALSQNVKFGEMYISRISNFVSENPNNINNHFNLHDDYNKQTNKQTNNLFHMSTIYPKIVLQLWGSNGWDAYVTASPSLM